MNLESFQALVTLAEFQCIRLHHKPGVLTFFMTRYCCNSNWTAAFDEGTGELIVATEITPGDNEYQVSLDHVIAELQK